VYGQLRSRQIGPHRVTSIPPDYLAPSAARSLPPLPGSPGFLDDAYEVPVGRLVPVPSVIQDNICDAILVKTFRRRRDVHRIEPAAGRLASERLQEMGAWLGRSGRADYRGRAHAVSAVALNPWPYQRPSLAPLRPCRRLLPCGGRRMRFVPQGACGVAAKVLRPAGVSSHL